MTSHFARALATLLACWPPLTSGAGFVEELHIPASTAALVRIEQLGVDFRVTAEFDGRRVEADQPAGRTGPEILALGPFASDQTVRLTLEPVGLEAEASDFSISWHPATAGAADFAAASLLMDAGQAVARSARQLRSGDPDGSRASLDSAVRFYQSAASLEVVELSAYAAFLLASTHHRLFQLEEALAALELAASEDCVPTPFCYKPELLKAEIVFAQDDHAGAVEHYTAGLAMLADTQAPEHAKELDQADALAVLGFARVLAGGSREDGKRELDAARSIASRRGDNLILGKTHNNLGGFDAVARDYRSARTHLERAVGYFELTDDLRGHVYALGNLSQTHYYVGDFESARRVSRKGVALAESGFDPSMKVSAYSTLGRVYEALGDFDKAEQFARFSLEIDERSGRSWRSYVSRAAVGAALRYRGFPEEALAHHLESLDFFRAEGPPERVTTLLNELVLDYLDLEQYEEALIVSEEAWSRREGTTGMIRSADFVSARARALIAGNRLDAALDLLTQTHQDYQRSDHLVAAKIEIADLLMLANRSIGELDIALQYGMEAAELILDVGGELEFYRLGPAWTSRSHGTILEVVDLLLALHERSPGKGHDRSAFAFLNRYRASNLLQQRSFASATMESSDSEELEALRAELAIVSHRRASSVGKREDEFQQLSSEYYRLIEQYQNALAVRPRLSSASAVDTVEDLQPWIPEGTVVVQYTCPARRLCHAFTMTASDFRVHRLAAEAQIRDAKVRAAGAIRSQQWTRENEEALREFGRLIISDIVPESTRHIVAVASFPIGDFPLGAVDGSPAAAAYVPLIDSHSITLIPSVDAFANAARSPEYSADVAIFADPVFSTESVLTATALSENVDSSLRGWADSLARLPWSAREAEEVRRLFSDQRVLSYTGDDATKDRLLSDTTRGTRVLHIASHAFFSERTPDLVGIATAQSADAAGDGFVTLQELLARPFLSELVVVAGCETGLGADMQGEGMMSIGRGFMAQGVDQVISTRWPVSDRASAVFMSEFYRALALEGRSIAAALRSAQLKLRNTNRYQAPFYWAAYVLDTMSVPGAHRPWQN